MTDEGYQPFPDISAWTAVPFDPTTYEQYAALLEQARAEASEEAREHAVKTAMRYAGTDTGAIEGLYTTDRGFTRTVAIEAAGWEAAANERGPNAAEIIKDQIAAYEWVLDLVTQERPVTEHVIRELHAMLCRSQETYVVHTPAGTQERPLPKGAYKEFPNNPTSLATGQIHHYAPPDTVGPEMARLVAAMGSDEYAAAHPVVQAAFVHYSLAAIHPFADGNGRVSRALASVPLYGALRVPLLIFREARDAYLDVLAEADRGNLGAFVSFVTERVVDVADLVTLTVRVGPAADRARSVDRLRELSPTTHGVKHDELVARAYEVRWAIEKVVKKQLDDAEWPAEVAVRDRHLEPYDEDLLPLRRKGYDWLDPTCGSRYEFTHLSPKNPNVAVAIAVAVSSEGSGPPVIASTTAEGVPDMEMALRDVAPALRESARIKAAHWATQVIDVALDALAQAVPRAQDG